MDNLMIKT